MVGTKKAHVWAKRVAAFERSGESRRAWCAGQGLSPNTLDYWRVRLRGGNAAPSLVPIVVESGSQSSGAHGAPGVDIELPGGVRIRATANVDAAWLSAVLRGMVGC